MMRHDWRETMILLTHVYPRLGWLVAQDYPTLWFKPTTEER